MGQRNCLIEGLSGAGKTSVAEALAQRGHHVIHGDRVLAYPGDPESGAPMACPPVLSPEEQIAWRHAHWIWPEERVRALVADPTHPITFFCGGSRNHPRLLPLFDRVFVLMADPATLAARLARRPADEFGGTAAERAFVAGLRPDWPPDAIRIDATRPLTEVVDRILGLC